MKPFTETHRGAIWTAADEMASEHETGDFLHGLIRLLKPSLVLETGCYNGDTSRRIGEALEANGRGELHTCDTDARRVENAMIRTHRLPVTVHCMAGIDLCRQFAEADMVFLDSSGDRVEEARAVRLSPCGIVVLHDAKRPALPAILEACPTWASVSIDSPRGVAILGKSLVGHPERTPQKRSTRQ